MHAFISSTRSNVRLSWDRSALGEKKYWSNNNLCPLILVRHFTYSWIEEDGVLEVLFPGLGGTWARASKNSIIMAGSEEYLSPHILFSHLNHPLNTQCSLRVINAYSSISSHPHPLPWVKKQYNQLLDPVEAILQLQVHKPVSIPLPPEAPFLPISPIDWRRKREPEC